jgi:hypothetical protein
MRVVILSGLLVTGVALTARADAASQSWTVDGTQLEMNTICAERVEIEPQAGLVGKIIVEATAERVEELTPVTVTGGETARVERTGSCDGNLLHKITLNLSIKVPAGMPIDFRNGGSGDYSIGSVGGPLKARLSGKGDLTGGDFTSLDLEIAGSSDVTLGKLAGPASINIHGSGDVRIDSGTMPSLKIAVAGSGDVAMSAGEIGSLDVSVAGSGDVTLHATAQTASLSSAGSGDIVIGKVTGNVNQRTAGSGEIHIGG